MSDQMYLYAIADADAVDPTGMTGLKDTDVTTVSHDDLAAVVSPAPDGKLRPRRRNLKAHHDLLKALMGEATILPMAYGVLADSEGQVTAFLQQHTDTLHAQLKQVRGHVEIGFRATWNVDDIFEHFVEQYEELRELRDSVFGEEGEPSRQEKIHVGERFEALLEEARMKHRATVEEYLRTACRAIEADDPQDESEVMNLACLVPRDGEEEFEDAVVEAAEVFSDDFTFTYTDPMAPYSFADVAFEEVRA